MTATLIMYGADWCKDCRRASKHLAERGIDYTYVDLVADPDRAAEARAASGRTNIPVLVFTDGTVLVEPTNAEIDEALAAAG